MPVTELAAPVRPTLAAAPRTTRLTAGERHLARRFSGGITPELAAQMRSAGGAARWFEQQLHPAHVGDPRGARIDAWFPSLHRTPAQIFKRQQDEVEGAWEVMGDLSRWTVARRIHSTRQVQELMVDFWSNLLHVPLLDDSAMFHRVSYDRMIRRYALGTFEELLLHSTTHPAMGLYLDNAVSTKDAPNENLGRELLELHTVGREAYDEGDVKASSRILTGWRVDLYYPRFRAFYDPSWHATGRVRVLGFSRANTRRDGRPVTRAYLRYLAHHPATARRIARRLCVRLVHDDPSPALVDRVAAAYTRSGTSIRPTLRALVTHPEFLGSAGEKVRTPMEDYVATVRALGTVLRRPTSDESFANAMYWQYRSTGQAPYEWPAPNGAPEVNAAWSSAGRVLTSFALHRDLTAHYYPSKGADFRDAASLLPAAGATLQEAVDHVGLRVLGQRPGVALSEGVAAVLGWPLSRRLSRQDLKGYWTGIAIVSTLLDSPLHLHR